MRQNSIDVTFVCLLSRWWSFNRVKIISRYLVCLPIHKILSHQILFSCRCWYYWWWSSHERDESRSVIKIKINAESLSLWNHTSSFFFRVVTYEEKQWSCLYRMTHRWARFKKATHLQSPRYFTTVVIVLQISFIRIFKKGAQLPIWRRFLIKYLWKSPSYPYLN